MNETMTKGRQKIPLAYASIGLAPTEPGIYTFWCRKPRKCIYIGESKNIRQRLLQHWKESSSERLQLWIRAFSDYLDICYFPVNGSTDKRRALEKKLILKLKPEANSQHQHKS